jgi:hypothetical protein
MIVMVESEKVRQQHHRERPGSERRAQDVVNHAMIFPLGQGAQT